MEATIWSVDTSKTPGDGQKIKTFFSESGRVTYQLTGNGAWNTMHAYILSLFTPSAPGVGSKGQTFFLKGVMLHIKLKGIKHRTPCLDIICPDTHPRPLGWGQKVKKTFFSESSHVASQIKLNVPEHRTPCKQINILFFHTPSVSAVGSKGQHFFLNMVMLHINLKGKK